MVEYNWPSREKSAVIGKEHDRIDGLVKATGAAKYTYDINLKNQLIAIGLGCPHGHCRIRAIDVSEAKMAPGVVHVHVFDHAQPGREVEWEGELLAVVAAENEAAARDGLSRIKLDLEKLEVFTSAEDLEAAKKAGRSSAGGGKVETEREPGDDDDEEKFIDAEIERLLKASAHVVEGYYGIDAITHCCLEPHGSTVEWKNGTLEAHLSTQNVSGTDEQLARDRSEERRVGKECRSRWSPYH